MSHLDENFLMKPLKNETFFTFYLSKSFSFYYLLFTCLIVISNSSVNGVTFLNDDQIVSLMSCDDDSFNSLIRAFASIINRTGSDIPLITRSNATVKNTEAPEEKK